MKTTPVKFWLGLLLAVVGVYGGYSGWRMYQRLSREGPAEVLAVAQAATGPNEGDPIGRFQLTERSGKPFDSASLDGQVWVASFFFSSCPGACLKMNGTIAELHKELADLPIRFVSITVDPKNDTPERLREYARHYGADPERWLFLTGDAEAIRRLATDEFGVAFAATTHSERLFVVGRDGRIESSYRGTDPTDIELVKRKLSELGREQP
jgi:cytochrome oxidase Cu insertion factor (SCO1/SenC/PrrC family)